MDNRFKTPTEAGRSHHRTGTRPAGRADSWWTTPKRCPPPAHTRVHLGHEHHRTNNKFLDEEKEEDQNRTVLFAPSRLLLASETSERLGLASVNHFFRWRPLKVSFSCHSIRGLESQTYPRFVHGAACLRHTGGAVGKGWISLALKVVL